MTRYFAGPVSPGPFQLSGLRARALAVALLVVFGGGCAYMKEFLKPRPKPTRYKKAVLVSEASPAKFPDDKRAWFEKTLRQNLFNSGYFKEGPELAIKWRVLAYKDGNQAVRYFSGGESGAAKLTVEVKFCHPDGEELARMERECKMESGLLGGWVESLVADCAREIATYANKNHYGSR